MFKNRVFLFLVGLWIILSYIIASIGIVGFLLYIGSNKIAALWFVFVAIPLTLGFADYASMVVGGRKWNGGWKMSEDELYTITYKRSDGSLWQFNAYITEDALNDWREAFPLKYEDANTNKIGYFNPNDIIYIEESE